MPDRYDGRLRSEDWIVGDADFGRARSLICQHHYAHGVSHTGVAVHGLYRKDDLWLAGVAWWLPPAGRVSKDVWGNPKEVLSLSRMVVLPDVPKNAATFLLSRSSKLLPARWKCLQTFADTWQGHTGHIYKAAGWDDMGLTEPMPVYLKDGRMVSRKATKTKSHAEMLASGAEYLGDFPKLRFRMVRRVRRAEAVAVQTSYLGLGD